MVRDGRVLLGRRSAHKTYAGGWDVPGGHVELGESLEDALLRELAEELGMVPTIWALHSTPDARHIQLHLFIVSQWRGSPSTRGDEHSEIRWHELPSACRLPDLAAPQYVEIFRALSKEA